MIARTQPTQRRSTREVVLHSKRVGGGSVAHTASTRRELVRTETYETRASVRPVYDIFLVLDTSGSMAGRASQEVYQVNTSDEWAHKRLQGALLTSTSAGGDGDLSGYHEA
jgi:hypothetical protein